MFAISRPRGQARISRTRGLVALFAGVALMNAGMAAASAVSTIVAADRLGMAWGGIPNTAGVAGTGLGALAMTRVMNRQGRRAGLLLGYSAAAAGGGLTVAAAASNDIAALSAGMLLLGLGNAVAQLSRYAAAELYPAQRRGYAISAVIWAATAGAVGGPLLLAPSGAVAAGLGWAAVTGPFLLASLASVIAVFAAAGAPVRAVGHLTSQAPLRDLVRTPAARSALAVMATGQVVMVAVMTATPLDMHMRGEGLRAVGTVLSAHTLGMFALSPLTGRLCDRLGPQPVMLAGLSTLAAATGFAASGLANGTVLRTAALFLLGYGWNLCFIGGSTRLARDVPAADQTRVEGAVDAAVWGAAAAASLASTVILAAGGYAVLAGAAGVLAVLPATVLLGRRRPGTPSRPEGAQSASRPDCPVLQ